jgi:hypothetical protein
MLSSQFFRILALGCLALAVPAIVLGQSGYSTVGGEYRLVGALPGDQVAPSVSVGPSGGYIVWQDNATDGDGWGISARPLNSGFQGVLPPFRVNSTGKYDQENPKVALLNNGGAVFVWQGGRQGFQHIYARFLSSSNTWIALDQMINASTRLYQANPSVAVLSNGNVVIVYAQYNTNTMQDVYAQVLSPTGVKIGSEIQLNQFTAYNQRSPAVVAFNDGFVAAWISEQQRTIGASSDSLLSPRNFTLPSVDVYARVFDSNGAAMAAEFQANSTSNVCANPAVSAASDGTVMFGWSGADVQVRGNSWDIYARPFTFSGAIPLGGTEQRVNTQLYGDQFAPRIGAQETNFFFVWTSLGQDGSRAGVYGQIFNSDGSRVGGEFKINTTTFSSQQEPTVTSDNAGRFLTAWTSPTYSANRNDLFAQIYAGGSFIPPASVTNYGSPTFVGEPAPTKGQLGVTNGSYLSPYYEAPTLGYPGAVWYDSSEIPAANAFALASGNYNGLFYDTKGVSRDSAGKISVKVLKDKSYSGSVLIDGQSYPLIGKFDDLGATAKIVSRAGLGSLVVSMQLDLFGAQQIHGTVKTGNWTASLFADRQTSDAADYKGSYTANISAGRTGPEGSGYGTITVNSAGKVTFAGKLADDTPITLSTTLSKSGFAPIYYNASGEFLMAWIQFNADAPSNLSGGDIVWIKPARRSSPTYPSGFTNEVSSMMGLNVPAVPGSRQVYLAGGGLDSADNSAQIGAKNKVLSKSANLTALTISTNGVFTGSAKISGKTISFKGALLNGSGGEGYFMNGKASGKVKLDNSAP